MMLENKKLKEYYETIKKVGDPEFDDLLDINKVYLSRTLEFNIWELKKSINEAIKVIRSIFHNGNN